MRRAAVKQAVWRSAQTGHLDTWKGFAQRGSATDPGRRTMWGGILDAAAKTAPIAAGEAVLDIGGGLDSVLDFVPDVTPFALDPLAAELHQLAPNPTIRFTGGVFERMPFRTGCFDRVFLMNVLDHVRDPLAGMREIRRVLRPGGALVLSVDTYRGRVYWEKRAHKWWARTRGARTKHPWVFSNEDVERALRESGFEPSAPSHVSGTKARRTLFTAR